MKMIACALGLSLLLLSCGGGHRTPTSPQNQVIASVFLDSFTANGGVLQATVSLDGQELGHSDWTTLKNGCEQNCQVLGSEDIVPAAGMHTVTVKVVRQTLDVISYNVQGSLFLASPTSSATIPLILQQADLKAGGTVDFGFTT